MMHGSAGGNHHQDVDITMAPMARVGGGAVPVTVTDRADERAAEFASWYQTSVERVRTVVTGVCGDAGLAEEATAEAFARAFARWSHVRSLDSPTAWVCRVAINEVRGRFRRRRVERRYLERQRLGHHPPPTEPDTALWQALATLSPRARTAVVLRYVADLTEAQTADAMRIPAGTVASLLSRSRKQLARVLAETGSQGGNR